MDSNWVVTEVAGLDDVAALVGEPRRVSHSGASFTVMALDLAPMLGAAKPLIVSGRGATAAAARRTCLGEAAERLALQWRPGIACVKAKVSRLGAPPHLPPGLDPGEKRWDWLPIEPLNGGPARFAPACLVHLGHPEARRLPGRLGPDSSGAAAGARLSSARRRALLELIERDAVAAWWHGRKRVPGFGAASLGDERMNRLALELMEAGRLLCFLTLDGACGVPAVACVSVRTDGTSLVIGTAAGRSRRDAAVRAAGELAQNLLGADALPAHQPGPGRERLAFDWLTRARLSDEPHLYPSGAVFPDERTTPGQAALLSSLRGKGSFVYAHSFPPQHGVPVVRLFATGFAAPRNMADSTNAWTYPF